MERNAKSGVRLGDFVRNEVGQDLVEYALLAGCIGLGAVMAMSGLGTKVSTTFSSVASRLTSSI